MSLRTLSDGRQFHVVKRLWTPDELAAEGAPLGWTLQACEHEGLFLSAAGRRSR